MASRPPPTSRSEAARSSLTNRSSSQPTAGDFKAFSSTCTHQGCQVTSVADGNINCPCHNSFFSIEDGSVTGGPASSSLPEVAIAVKGDQITLA